MEKIPQNPPKVKPIFDPDFLQAYRNSARTQAFRLGHQPEWFTVKQLPDGRVISLAECGCTRTLQVDHATGEPGGDMLRHRCDRHDKRAVRVRIDAAIEARAAERAEAA